MTNSEFNKFFNQLTTREILSFITNNCTSISFNCNVISQSYTITSKDDFRAAYKQELYELKTGRE